MVAAGRDRGGGRQDPTRSRASGCPKSSHCRAGRICCRPSSGRCCQRHNRAAVRPAGGNRGGARQPRYGDRRGAGWSRCRRPAGRRRCNPSIGPSRLRAARRRGTGRQQSTWRRRHPRPSPAWSCPWSNHCRAGRSHSHPNTGPCRRQEGRSYSPRRTKPL